MKRPISQRKNLPIDCAQGRQPVRWPNRGFCVHQALAVPFGGGWLCFCGGDVMCCDVVCDVMGLVGCEVTRGEVMSSVARCNVMWCHVYVMQCDAM